MKKKLMQRNTTSSGYILLTTIMLIAIITVLVTSVYYRGSAHVPLMRTLVDREQAKTLALGGLQLAIQQVAQHEEPKKKDEQKAEQEKTDPGQLQLKQLLPNLNRWQRFILQKKLEGVEAQVDVCIMCEDGKININKLFDFENHMFVGETKDSEGTYKPLIKELFKSIEKATKRKNLFTAFEKFLKNRAYPLDDVTELLAIKEFDVFKQTVFYVPPPKSKKIQKKDEKKPLYLTDIFTVFSGVSTLEPWLLSDSVRGVLGLQRIVNDDEKRRQQIMEEALKSFKPKIKWQTDWDTILMPLYGKNFSTLPKGIEALLADKFEPMIFSVLSYSKVGNVTQKIFAILERTKSKDTSFLFDVNIKRIYWI